MTVPQPTPVIVNHAAAPVSTKSAAKSAHATDPSAPSFAQVLDRAKTQGQTSSVQGGSSGARTTDNPRVQPKQGAAEGLRIEVELMPQMRLVDDSEEAANGQVDKDDQGPASAREISDALQVEGIALPAQLVEAAAATRQGGNERDNAPARAVVRDSARPHTLAQETVSRLPASDAQSAEQTGARLPPTDTLSAAISALPNAASPSQRNVAAPAHQTALRAAGAVPQSPLEAGVELNDVQKATIAKYPDEFMRHLGESLDAARYLSQEAGRALSSRSDTETSALPQPVIAAAPLSVPAGTAPGVGVVSGPIHSVPATFGDSGWGSAMANQVAGFIKKARSGEHIAQLRLDPPELGPIRVSISLSDGVAQATFGSAHVQVRQAIEQALPDLARALSQAGIDLGQTDVRDDSSGFAFGNEGTPTQRGSSSASGSESPDEPTQQAQPRSDHQGLVNTFA